MDTNKVLSGSDGTAYINGIVLGDLSSIELKVTGTFSEFSVCGNMKSFYKYTGYTIDGSIKFQKTTSRGMNLLSQAYISGIMPDIKIVSMLTDKSSGQTESASVSDVVLTEFHLANFSSKGLIDEVLPLKASTYEVLSTIAD